MMSCRTAVFNQLREAHKLTSLLKEMKNDTKTTCETAILFHSREAHIVGTSMRHVVSPGQFVVECSKVTGNFTTVYQIIAAITTRFRPVEYIVLLIFVLQ